jgi:hypothetical protein
MTVIGFNDAFGRRYSEIADVVNAAKELAATDARAEYVDISGIWRRLFQHWHN